MTRNPNSKRQHLGYGRFEAPRQALPGLSALRLRRYHRAGQSDTRLNVHEYAIEELGECVSLNGAGCKRHHGEVKIKDLKKPRCPRPRLYRFADPYDSTSSKPFGRLQGVRASFARRYGHRGIVCGDDYRLRKAAPSTFSSTGAYRPVDLAGYLFSSKYADR